MLLFKDLNYAKEAEDLSEIEKELKEKWGVIHIFDAYDYRVYEGERLSLYLPIYNEEQKYISINHNDSNKKYDGIAFEVEFWKIFYKLLREKGFDV